MGLAGPKILVVDDESSVRRFICHVLDSAGYETIEAEDGLAACELLSRFPAEVKLAITDIRMPQMNGAQLVELLAAEYPNVKILCMSGNGDSLCPKGHYFLPKPFKAAALLVFVRDILEILPVAENCFHPAVV